MLYFQKSIMVFKQKFGILFIVLDHEWSTSVVVCRSSLFLRIFSKGLSINDSIIFHGKGVENRAKYVVT